MKVFTETIDFKRVKQFLAEGCKVSLLIRHSERPKITPGDTTFGHSLALTPRGEEMAREAGRLLAGPYDVRFLSSPMVRCQMTASCLAEGMGCPDAEVADEPILGLKNFYYDEAEKLPGEMMRCGYIQYMLDYLRTGSALYSHDVAVATPQMVAWMQRMTTQQLNVLVSHDIFVAALLAGIKARTYTAENWVGFLHSSAVICTVEQDWLFYPCAPSLDATGQTSFVQ
ncbi:MAG: histidine phosphatase family protein [bacterium]